MPLKFSEIISLPVINLSGVNFEGFVENVLVDKKTFLIQHIVIYNEKEDCKYSLKPKDISHFSKDCIVIKNQSKLTLLSNVDYELENYINPINTPCYTIDGLKLGIVNDIEFDKNKIISIIVSGKSYNYSTISGLSSILTILSLERKIRVTKYNKIRKIYNTSIKNDQPVYIMTKENITPQRKIMNYNFLLNRTTTNDIKNFNGEILVQKNTKISDTILKKVKQYGKLKELIINSK